MRGQSEVILTITSISNVSAAKEYLDKTSSSLPLTYNHSLFSASSAIASSLGSTVVATIISSTNSD